MSKNKLAKVTIIWIFLLGFFAITASAFASLSCSISTVCNSPSVVVLRMASTANSHAELPGQNNYSQLVCCSGVTGLGNSCSGTHAIAVRLSGDSNAHVEENTQSTATYDGHDACLSISSGTVSVGYAYNNCNSFDTTLVSISKTPTNAHVGDAGTYPRKVCVSASSSGTPPIDNNFCSSIYCGGASLVNALNIYDKDGKVSEETKKKILATADFNNDGKVNILDLSILLYHIDQGDNAFSIYDLNKDGILDFLDVSILFYYWDNTLNLF